jgi:hypothetical protein
MRDRVLRQAAAVQCRIEIRQEDEQVVVRLAGRLGEAQVGDLLEACSRTANPPRLELDDLMSADALGLEALWRIEQRGGQLIGLPQYLRLRLNDLAHDRRR